MQYLLRVTLAVLVAAALSGCTVITVAGIAAGAAITAADLAVDAAVGTVKLTGKAVGAVLPDGDEEEEK
jgi:organic hydroperoxide reductase OsmC/OhrA